MNKQETKEILAAIAAVYPQLQLSGPTIEAWAALLEPYEYKDIHAACICFFQTPAQFPPTPGQILEKLRERVRPPQQFIDERFEELLRASSPYLKNEREALDPIQFQLGKDLGWNRLHMANTLTEVPWLRKEFSKAYAIQAESEIRANLPLMLRNGFQGVLGSYVKRAIEHRSDAVILRELFNPGARPETTQGDADI
jgi:hypothetical protein